MAIKKFAKDAFAHQLFICGRSMKRDAEGWIWRRGVCGVGTLTGVVKGEMIEVSIYPSTTGKRPDFKVLIGIAGKLVFEEWRPTEEECAAFASRKLWTIFVAIGGNSKLKPRRMYKGSKQ